MKFRFIPKSTSILISLLWSSLTKVNPLKKNIIIGLAALLFITDIGYEGQRSPGDLLPLVPLSLASIGLFFAIYFPLVYALRRITNHSMRGILQFFVVISAEIAKSAFLIFFFRPENFLAHYLERLPGDITLAALFWLLAGVTQATTEDHILAISELNKASEKLAKQRSVSLKTAGEVEKELHNKASSVLLKDLNRLSELSRQIMDSAKASEVKLDIQRLIRNQVRPLSRELKSRVEVLESLSPTTAPYTRIRQVQIVPAVDSSFVASYVFAMPNIFFTILSKTDTQSSLLILLVSLSYPIIGRLLQNLTPRGNTSIPSGLGIASVISLLSYIPTGVTIFSVAQTSPALQVTTITALGVLVLTSTIGTAWFALQRERSEMVEEIKGLNKDAERELDLLDQAIWVAQRRWSYLIHGTVQAALTVAASRLELAKKADSRLREDVESDINRAKQALTTACEPSESSSSLMDEIVDTWQGVCSVEYQIAPSAQLALDQNPTSTTCFIEIVKELVSNAGRHGGASKFWLNAYLNADGDLEIITGNNGKPIPNNVVPGLGFKMITDLTKEWQFDRNSGGFSATLPMPRPSKLVDSLA